MANETTMEQARKREGASASQPEQIRGGRVYSPPVDIVETENELLLVADVPERTAIRWTSTTSRAC